MSVSDSLFTFSHPSFGWVDLPVYQILLNSLDQEQIGSHKFSSFLSFFTCHALAHRQTLQNLTFNDSFVLASTRGESVAICFNKCNDADLASGMCISPVTCKVLCVRFTSIVHVDGRKKNHTAVNVPPEAQHSILVVG